MLEKLMPKSDQFFDDFDELAKVAVEGARQLKALLDDYTDVPTKVKAIKDVEHRGDELTHHAFERLHTQFITPFDRGEIHRLLSRIDDVLDLADAAAGRLQLYEIREVLPTARDIADVLWRSTQKMQEAVAGLRTVRQPEKILQACKDINTCENEADQLLRAGLAALFKSGADPLTVIKWKEILDLLETATDRCEDVANVIEGVVLEHA